MPPATSTVPSGSRVAAWAVRAAVNNPVTANVPVPVKSYRFRAGDGRIAASRTADHQDLAVGEQGRLEPGAGVSRLRTQVAGSQAIAGSRSRTRRFRLALALPPELVARTVNVVAGMATAGVPATAPVAVHQASPPGRAGLMLQDATMPPERMGWITGMAVPTMKAHEDGEYWMAGLATAERGRTDRSLCGFTGKRHGSPHLIGGMIVWNSL